MAKVFLGVGHGGSDPGAVKYLREEDVNLQMALGCRDYLEANGVKVKMSRTKDENDTLNEEIKECNAYKPDLAVDIHNNAGGGDGFECYYHYKGGKSKTLAQNIEKEVKAIGQNTRGIKTKKGADGQDYYGFIRETVCPSVITEGLFVDNKTDVKIADTVKEQKAFGEAIAKGILKTLGIAPKSVPQKTKPAKATTSSVSKNYTVKVVTEVLNIREGAGSNYEVVGQIKDRGVYTIIAEADGKGANKWGKLKSGAGWISLDYTKIV